MNDTADKPSIGGNLLHDVHLTSVRLGDFGKYHDRTVGQFSPGLNVVYGPNEVGKSSTVECVRQVLYGWNRASGTGNRNDYMPRGSRTRSGSIFLADTNGEWELERSGSKTTVNTVQGLSWDAAFADVVANVSKETYTSVFSFAADDLQRIEQSSDDMTSQLLTAGSGTQRVPMDVLNSLTSQVRGLSSVRKNGPGTIREIQDHIVEVQQEIDTLSQQAHELEEERLELARIDGLDARLSRKREDAEKELLVCRRLQHDLETNETERERYSEAIATAREDCYAKEADCQAAEPTAQERAVLDTASKREAAFADLAELRSASDRCRDRREELGELEENLARRPSSGCDIGGAMKQALADRQNRRAELEGALKTAQRNLRDAELTVAGADAGQRAHQETRPKRNPADPFILVAGIAAVVVAVVVLVLGVLFNGGWVSILGACVLGILGILLVILGVRHLAGRGEEPLSNTYRSRLEAMAEQQGIAQQQAVSAQRDLDDFNRQSLDFLNEHGFAAAQGSLGHAQGMLEEETITEGKRVELSGKKESYENSVDQCEQLVRRIRVKFPGNTRVAGMDADELIAWLPGMYAQLQDAQRKEREYQTNSAGLKRARAELESLCDRAERLSRERLERIEDAGMKDEDNLELILQRRIASREEDLGQLDTQREAMHTRRGELTAILDTAARDERLSMLRSQLEDLRARRTQQAETLAETVVAQKIMDHAIASWEQEKQPEVYLLASRLFSTMTGGAWLRVNYDGNEVFVANASKQTLTPEKLSCGTRQQLYLALRVALLLLARNVGTCLPVLADDILVNFDEDRRVGAAQAMMALAEERQVILFTCHRTTRNLFKALAPSTNIVELGV